MGRMGEGDRVEVRGMAGHVRFTGTVDRVEDGFAIITPDGKVKPKPIALGRVRLLDRPAPAPGPVVAKPDRSQPSIKPQPKPLPPARDRVYQRWIASLPCCHCGSRHRVDAHHWAPKRGIAQKVDDYRTVPLCRVCHDHVHDHGHLEGLTVLMTRHLFMEKQITYVIAWFRSGGVRDQASSRPPRSARTAAQVPPTTADGPSVPRGARGGRS